MSAFDIGLQNKSLPPTPHTLSQPLSPGLMGPIDGLWLGTPTGEGLGRRDGLEEGSNVGPGVGVFVGAADAPVGSRFLQTMKLYVMMNSSSRTK